MEVVYDPWCARLQHMVRSPSEYTDCTHRVHILTTGHKPFQDPHKGLKLKEFRIRNQIPSWNLRPKQSFRFMNRGYTTRCCITLVTLSQGDSAGNSPVSDLWLVTWTYQVFIEDTNDKEQIMVIHDNYFLDLKLTIIYIYIYNRQNIISILLWL